MAEKTPIPLALLIGVISISTASILTRTASANPAVIAAYRLGIASLILLPLTVVNRRAALPLTFKDFSLVIGAGFFLAIHFILWNTSLQYTSIASSVTLVTLQPLFVLAGSYLLWREAPNRQGLLGMGIAILGALLIGGSDWSMGSRALCGDLLAFLGGGAVAIYWLLGRLVRKRIKLLTYTFWVYSAATLFLLGWAIFQGAPLALRSSDNIFIYIALALVPTLLGHSVFNWALRYVSATTVSLIILGEPVGASIFAYFLWGEAPGWKQLLGGCLVLIGIGTYLSISQDRATFIRKDL